MVKQPPHETQASSATLLNRALAAHQTGNLAEAEHLYKLVLAGDAKQFDAMHMLAIIQAQRGNFAESDRLFLSASEANPNHAPCHYNHGNVLIELKQFEKALSCYDKALTVAPGYIEAHFNRGNALFNCGKFGEALASYDNALRLNPKVPEIHSSRGNALQELKRFDEALASFDQALVFRPADASFNANRGNVLHKLGRLDEALASYNKALAIKPDDAEFYYNCGNILSEIGQLDEALVCFDRALTTRPGDAEFHHNRGNVLLDLGRFEDALADYEKAWAINPQLSYLEGARLFTRMHICDWRSFDSECTNLLTNLRQNLRVSAPFSILAIASTPADQLHCAQIYVDDKYPAINLPVSGGRKYRSHDRIRVAYLSADLQNHAIAHLTAGLFEQHDRARFETTAVSFGFNDGSAMRTRMIKAFDHFVDVHNKSSSDVANLIREMEIDIAVDVNGFTQHSRPNILAMRPAPLQINYLGYPGTMGANYIDYILADKVIIPSGHLQYYSEKVVYLPHSYQVNDATRHISERKLLRGDVGLPERGFVFCSFNNSYKISPHIFSCWMSLLQKVDGSVLWLLEGNGSSPNNLKSEAVKRGVSSDRLIFAPRVPNEDHLARHRLADLFLDTLPYNAHTTTSDALWAGVPVLTCLGSTFAGRVAASLLTAVGLPELITESIEDYESLALKLARDPEALIALNVKLASNRDTFPLFDTRRFVRHIESAYITIRERYQRGQPATSFAVDAVD